MVEYEVLASIFSELSINNNDQNKKYSSAMMLCQNISKALEGRKDMLYIYDNKVSKPPDLAF